MQLLQSGYLSPLVILIENLHKYSLYHDNKRENDDGSDVGGSNYDCDDEKVRKKWVSK